MPIPLNISTHELQRRHELHILKAMISQFLDLFGIDIVRSILTIDRNQCRYRLIWMPSLAQYGLVLVSPLQETQFAGQKSILS
jgi:hypothetical protein